MPVMKKIVVFLATIAFAGSGFAQSVDYSRGNTNPFAHYVYHTDAQTQAMQQAQAVQAAQKAQPVNYFNNQLSNPLSLKQQQSKYRNLMNSSESLQGCWDKAGAAYNIDPWLLLSIAKVESGFNQSATNVNSNRSVDIGMMQINSSWLPTLNRFGITVKDLFNPCTSVFVGAWIMAQNIQHFGYNMDGIGAYNSPGNVTIRRRYAMRVYAAYNELTRDFHSTMLASQR